MGKFIQSSKRKYMYRHPLACRALYWWNHRTYGEPGFDEEIAREVLRRTREAARTGQTIYLSDEERDHLRGLGYLN
jgi:hypothetical protein